MFVRCRVILIVMVFFYIFTSPTTTTTPSLHPDAIPLTVGGVQEDLASLSPTPGDASEVAVGRPMSAAHAGQCYSPCLRGGPPWRPPHPPVQSADLAPLLANHGGDERICAPKPSSERERVHGRRLLPSGEGVNNSLARSDRRV